MSKAPKAFRFFKEKHPKAYNAMKMTTQIGSMFTMLGMGISGIAYLVNHFDNVS